MDTSSGSETDAPPGADTSAAVTGVSASAGASAGARRGREEDVAPNAQPESKRMRPARSTRKVDMIVDSEDDSDFWPSTDHIITDLPNVTPPNSRSPAISPARPRVASSPSRTVSKSGKARAAEDKDADFVIDQSAGADAEDEAKVVAKKKPPAKKGKTAPKKTVAKGRKKAASGRSATLKKAAPKGRPGSRQSKTAVSGNSEAQTKDKVVKKVSDGWNHGDDAKSGSSETDMLSKATCAIEMVTPPTKTTNAKGKKAAQPTTALQRVVAFVHNGRNDGAVSSSSMSADKPVKGSAKKTAKPKSPAPKIAKTITKSPRGKAKAKAKSSKSIPAAEDTDIVDKALLMPKAEKGAVSKSAASQEAKNAANPLNSEHTPVDGESSKATPSKSNESKATSVESNPDKTASGKATPRKGLLLKAPPRKTGKATEKKITPKSTPKKVKVAGDSKKAPKGKSGKADAQPKEGLKTTKSGAEGTAEKEKKSIPLATLGMLACSSRDSVTTSLLEHAVTQLGGYSMVDGSDGLSISAYIIGADTRRGWGILYAIVRGIPLVSESWLSASISAGHWLPKEKFLNTRFVSADPPKTPVLSGMRIKVAASGSDAPIIRKVVTAAGARVAQTRCDLVINDGEAVDENLSNVSKKWLADSIEKGRKLEVGNYLVASS